MVGSPRETDSKLRAWYPGGHRREPEWRWDRREGGSSCRRHQQAVGYLGISGDMASSRGLSGPTSGIWIFCVK